MGPRCKIQIWLNFIQILVNSYFHLNFKNRIVTIDAATRQLALATSIPVLGIKDESTGADDDGLALQVTICKAPTLAIQREHVKSWSPAEMGSSPGSKAGVDMDRCSVRVHP